jgi:hypothetical protein
MPSDDPARFLALRRGVDAAAGAMRYSSTGSAAAPGPAHPDAFGRLERVLRAALDADSVSRRR